jgi:hypothetical protein
MKRALIAIIAAAVCVAAVIGIVVTKHGGGPAAAGGTGSAQSAALEIIRKDYKYTKSGVEFDVHLENVGNSDKIYSLVNKLIYKNRNFDEYMEYTEKEFIEKYNGETEKFELYEKYAVVCGNGAYIIFENSGYEYTGGAHGSGGAGYVVIDLSEERIVDMKELISPVPDSLLNGTIKAKYDIGGYLRDNIWPPDAVNFCGENVELLWDRYSIAPYAFGQIKIEIQDSVIKRYLTDKGDMLRTGGVLYGS